jgi:nucleoside-diphosphate-sugar epimerase
METIDTAVSGKKVLITGGLGFIGSNLAQRLVKTGAEVTVYDACLDPYGWNRANLREVEQDIKVVVADVRDAETLAEHVKGKDLVYHLAAQVGREISMENPALDTDINCNGTLNLCQICAKEGGAKVVFAGSRGQIGEPIYLPVDEDHPTRPTDVYGINKLAAEKYLMLYGHIFDFPTVSLRLNNVYGPRCQMEHGYYGILNWFITKATQGEPITVYGDGQQTRDYIYIDDVVDAFVRAGVMEAADNQIYMIGAGVETVFLTMVKTVIDAVGKGHYIHIDFPPQRERIDIRKFVATSEKFHSHTGWTARVGLEDGVRKTVAFYRERWPDYVSADPA